MRTTYLTVVAVMFTGALVLQTQSKFMTDEYARARLFFFMAWSCFGFLPCTHWAILNGGFSHAFVLVRIKSKLILRLYHPPSDRTKVGDISGWMIKPVGSNSSSQCQLYCENNRIR